MEIDEAAMKIIADKLVDPWHKTFARDVVECLACRDSERSAICDHGLPSKTRNTDD